MMNSKTGSCKDMRKLKSKLDLSRKKLSMTLMLATDKIRTERIQNSGLLLSSNLDTWSTSGQCASLIPLLEGCL